MEKIANAIGGTPLVRVDCRLEGRLLHIYAKLESYNLTGSVKDRMVRYVLERARERGELRPGQPIVEVTSGNTGIALAAIGGSLGHPVHIFMPDWASRERSELMRLYGATVHPVSREEGGFFAALRMALLFAKEQGAYRSDQFNNYDNVLAHYTGLGPEILRELPDVGAFVAGVGTGGTLMGVGKRLREERDVRLVAVEPDAAPLLSGGKVEGAHRIEGIGDDFIPSIVDRRAIDEVVVLHDGDAICMAQRLARELGLGVGISSGANFLGALQTALAHPQRKVATVFADDNKKYLSTALAQAPGADAASLAGRIELLGYERVERD